ncbi:hypothetical protein NRB16_24655 [Pseudomonas sp. LJDD11]|uniref:hypothetical protein n=1 Tax=Pseudomonas sp. LJDD11 TaxID=2931984 RepID=UPI00211CF3ED|nr:hypothetical protein [Pseudomonas sp. LJDD11]MCQ9426715.1 hypothetical protein [Pseudomonas sp. LJDD11]
MRTPTLIANNQTQYEVETREEGGVWIAEIYYRTPIPQLGVISWVRTAPPVSCDNELDAVQRACQFAQAQTHLDPDELSRLNAELADS